MVELTCNESFFKFKFFTNFHTVKTCNQTHTVIYECYFHSEHNIGAKITSYCTFVVGEMLSVPFKPLFYLPCVLSSVSDSHSWGLIRKQDSGALFSSQRPRLCLKQQVTVCERRFFRWKASGFLSLLVTAAGMGIC